MINIEFNVLVHVIDLYGITCKIMALRNRKCIMFSLQIINNNFMKYIFYKQLLLNQR